MAQHDLVFYEKRSTPLVLARGAKAEPKPSYGKQIYRRAATAAEERTIREGRWVRVDEKGNKPTSSDYKTSKLRKNLGEKRAKTNKKIAGEGKS